MVGFGQHIEVTWGTIQPKLSTFNSWQRVGHRLNSTTEASWTLESLTVSESFFPASASRHDMAGEILRNCNQVEKQVGSESQRTIEMIFPSSCGLIIHMISGVIQLPYLLPHSSSGYL